MTHIVIVPGTNRANSVSLTCASLVEKDYRALGCTTDLLTMDLEADFIAASAYAAKTPAINARVERFLKADAAVFVIPEYNGSYPGILKLFIDMLPDKTSFNKRPCAFIGIAAGQFQALRAVEHFQGVAGYRNAYMFPNRIFIGAVHKAFSPDGQLTDPALRERFSAQAKDFVAFATALRK
jgi:chromate reductase, NAD(P)H dehydrogenase (quinone)